MKQPPRLGLFALRLYNHFSKTQPGSKTPMKPGDFLSLSPPCNLVFLPGLHSNSPRGRERPGGPAERNARQHPCRPPGGVRHRGHLRRK